MTCACSRKARRLRGLQPTSNHEFGLREMGSLLQLLTVDVSQNEISSLPFEVAGLPSCGDFGVDSECMCLSGGSLDSADAIQGREQQFARAAFKHRRLG